MLLLRKYYDNNQEVTDEVDFFSFEEASRELNNRFMVDQSAIIYDSINFGNGSKSVSLKDKHGKIIIQYKTK